MDEVAGLVQRFMGGLEVTEETLALDVIDRVGPGGHFLEEEHTYRHFRENWYPGLLDRHARDDWASRGSLTLGDRATARVRQIFETHQPALLDEATLAILSSIIERAEAKSGSG
jgi:trimethylamine--corrinoid protein Co-methyltransferase